MITNVNVLEHILSDFYRQSRQFLLANQDIEKIISSDFYKSTETQDCIIKMLEGGRLELQTKNTRNTHREFWPDKKEKHHSSFNLTTPSLLPINVLNVITQELKFCKIIIQELLIFSNLKRENSYINPDFLLLTTNYCMSKLKLTDQDILFELIVLISENEKIPPGLVKINGMKAHEIVSPELTEKLRVWYYQKLNSSTKNCCHSLSLYVGHTIFGRDYWKEEPSVNFENNENKKLKIQ